MENRWEDLMDNGKIHVPSIRIYMHAIAIFLIFFAIPIGSLIGIYLFALDYFGK